MAPVILRCRSKQPLFWRSVQKQPCEWKVLTVGCSVIAQKILLLFGDFVFLSEVSWLRLREHVTSVGSAHCEDIFWFCMSGKHESLLLSPRLAAVLLSDGLVRRVGCDCEISWNRRRAPHFLRLVPALFVTRRTFFWWLDHVGSWSGAVSAACLTREEWTPFLSFACCWRSLQVRNQPPSSRDSSGGFSCLV